MEFPDLWRENGVIAMKGLPLTGKSELAKKIGAWANCPVLYMDDFLYTLSKEKGYETTKLLPSPEEAERLHRVAFDGLCKAATRQLNFGSKCVVIKSRLSSTFELDRLAKLIRECQLRMIIIECQMKNEHRFRRRLDFRVNVNEEDWYRPRRWKNIEKVREQWDVDAQANWDLHLLHLLNECHFQIFPGVIRLVLDIFGDLHLDRSEDLLLTSSFQHVLKYLLQTTFEDREEDPNIRSGCRSSGYMVVQFNDVR